MKFCQILFAFLLAPSMGLKLPGKSDLTAQSTGVEGKFYNGLVLSEDEAKEKLKKSSVVFMLPQKNSMDDDFFPYVRANIEQIGSLFRDFTVVVGTPKAKDLHAKWKEEAQSGTCTGQFCSSQKKKYDVIVTTNETNKDFKTPWGCNGGHAKWCAIARGRDSILQFIREKQANKFDYAIAVDSDMAKQWSQKSFLKAFSLAGDWGMIASNGINSENGQMQDWLAWKSGSHHTELYHVFSPTERAMNVESAFGGVGIYDMKVLEKSHCSYSGCDACEHLCLANCLRKEGHKLYFHPGFIIEWPFKTSKKMADIEQTWKCGNKLCSPPKYGNHGREP